MDPILGMLTLGAATWLIGLLSVAFLFCSVLLILTVLIQRPQGGGLSGAFGAGAGSGETAFGARTGDALTIATISFFVIWLLVAVGLVWVMQPARPSGETQATSTEPPAMPTPGAGDATPTPPAAPADAAPANGDQPTDDSGAPPEGAGEGSQDGAGGPGEGGGR